MKNAVKFTGIMFLVFFVAVSFCLAGSGEEEKPMEVEEPAAVTGEDPNAPDPWLANLRSKYDRYRDAIDLDFRDKAGYPTVWDTEVMITVGERDKLRAGNYKAVMMIEWGSGEWTRANTSGIADTMEHYNIDISFVDAQLDAATQANQVETVVALKPDVVIFTSADDAASSTYAMPLIEAGIPVVLFSNIPEGWKHKTHFQSISSQNYKALADYSMKIIADNVPANPKIGIIYMDVAFGTMNIIANYVRDAVPKLMPGATVVEKGWIDMPKIYDLVDALLTTDPDIDGMWCSAMVQATYAQEACLDRGRNDIVISCFGVDSPTIISMLEGKPLRGAASDAPYLLGVNHAIVACGAILGKDKPPHIVTPVVPITPDNVEEGWQLSNHEVIPAEVRVVLQNYKARMNQ
ncbi:MAG: substrate-binding domain-containing protein [Spirochaetota bacterium]|nr:MAG: substrate-binding domain-containing protein [Spirochaetota bacterium]